MCFLSYSQLWDFWTCPRLSTYRQQPALHLQRSWHQQSARKGTAVHHFLHQATLLSDTEQERSALFQQFIADYPQIWARYQQWAEAQGEATYSEWGVEAPLPKVQALPYVLTGRLDRLILKEPQALIIDWKTGQLKDVEAVRLQLRFYAWLLWLARPSLACHIEEVVAEAHYLESGDCERWTLNAQNIDAEDAFFYALIQGYHGQHGREIEGIPDPRSTSEGLWCTMCEYQRLCPEGRYHAE